MMPTLFGLVLSQPQALGPRGESPQRVARMYVRSQAPFRSRAYHGYYEAKRLEGEWVLSRSGRNESN